MRALVAATLALWLFPPWSTSQESGDSLKKLYDAHHWFALRDATLHADSPPFYRAAVEAAFDQVPAAERDLGQLIATSPHSADAYEAHQLLATMYFRHGLYRKALEQLRAMANEKPGAKDVQNEMTLFAAFGKADQSTGHLSSSMLQMLREDGNLYLPIEIDGKTALYAFDTGANFSLISEAEASRLGLAVTSVDTSLADSSGNHVGMRVAVPKSLTVGGLQLHNVAFGVLPDTQPPFNELAEGKRGLLGIPILIAMQTVRWSSADGTFTLGGRSEQFNLQTANLAFEQMFPVTHAYFQGKGMDMTVDSGAEHTVLSPPFAFSFPDVLKSAGKPESHKLTGVGGSANYESVLLPSIDLQIGGLTVTLKNAHVLTQESSNESQWAAGNLGIDLLNEAKSTTLDFGAMKLTLQ
jgi:predicted aspartyl protease